MDKASLIGLIVGVACLGFVLFEVSHGNLMMFFSMEGVLMVGIGSVSVTFMGMPLEKIKAIPGYMKRFMFHKAQSSGEVIKLLSGLAEKARRDGILALESEMSKLKDPFLAAGLKMAVDGVEPHIIEATCRMELLAMGDRHKAGKKFFVKETGSHITFEMGANGRATSLTMHRAGREPILAPRLS